MRYPCQRDGIVAGTEYQQRRRRRHTLVKHACGAVLRPVGPGSLTREKGSAGVRLGFAAAAAGRAVNDDQLGGAAVAKVDTQLRNPQRRGGQLLDQNANNAPAANTRAPNQIVVLRGIVDNAMRFAARQSLARPLDNVLLETSSTDHADRRPVFQHELARARPPVR